MRDEVIQMEADARYQLLLKQEEAIEKAKAEGRPAPSFPPVLLTKKTPDVPASPEVRQIWKEKLDKTPPHERAAEEEALKAEQRIKAVVAMTAHRTWTERAKEREERIAEGKATLTDKMKGLFSSTTGK